jgi:hypothetical protein
VSINASLVLIQRSAVPLITTNKPVPNRQGLRPPPVVLLLISMTAITVLLVQITVSQKRYPKLAQLGYLFPQVPFPFKSYA